MLLRRLELFGFKSFAGRAKLEFGPGITALVGPNGSGKSNIADAIRWALGEQRLKSLRCEKIEDLIHVNPSGHRSPGFCQVTLVLDNTSGILPLDYAEVEVSRRVYRSGESEFKINRNRCRLKDIQELFLDTGLGKDTYALINQGQVENLLTMRAEERRLMLEEAAGILKYRYRKGEVLGKLAEAEQNIMRLNDLLLELKQQLSVLEEEAEQEKLYRQCRGDLEAAQIALSLREINSLQKQKEKELAKLREEYNRKQALETSLQTIEAKIEEEKLALHYNEEALSKERQELAIIQARIGRLREGIALREERRLSLQREREKKEEQQRIWLEKITEMERIERETQQRGELLQREMAQVQGELEAATKAMEQYRGKWQEKEEKLEADRDEAFELIRRQSQMKNELQLLSTRRESVKNSLEQRQQQLETVRGELSISEGERDNLRQGLEKWGNYLEKCQAKMASLATELEGKLLREENVRKTLRQRQGQLDQARNRLNLLRELESSFEGYYRGVQAVLRGHSRGIYGTVADLIQVDKHLEKAISVALGSTLQFLVAKNDEIAQDAIEYLLRNRAGRATFLPLNTIRPRTFPDFGRSLLSLPGVLGLASELVTTEGLFQPVVEFLLGQVVVVKDLSSARSVAQKGNYQVKIVSLNGELITPGGAISGGTLGKGQIQLLSRKREIEEWLNSCETLVQEIRSLEGTLVSLENTIITLRRDIEEFQVGEKKAEMELDRLGKEWEVLEKNIKRNENILITLERELKSAEKMLLDLDLNISLQEQGLSQMEKQDREVQERLREAEFILKEYKDEQEYHRDKITSLKVNYAKLDQQLKAGEDYLKKLTNQYSETKKVMLREKLELSNLLQEQTDLCERIELERGALTKDLREEAKVQGRVETLWVEREGKQKSLLMLQGEGKTQQRELAEVVERIHGWEKNLAKMDTSLSALKRRLFADHKLTPAQVEQHKQEGISRGKLRQRVAELERRLLQFGNINLRAGEQYKKVQDRYGFLRQQLEDLVEAKKTLAKLLEEIDFVSKGRLEKTFAKVQASFVKVFQELFDGGKAQLSLTNNEDPLQAGLEIMVQPPGKKLQNILLLSGGEKALAAIAFLFGILQVKPSPFCVLDEIDASLDDVNAVRLGSFLRRHMGKIQFLLITHRQEIIKQADALYGIAMDERGESQFLSLDIGDNMVG